MPLTKCSTYSGKETNHSECKRGARLFLMQIYAGEHEDVRLQGFYPGQKSWLTLVKMLSCSQKGELLNTSCCEAGRLQGA